MGKVIELISEQQTAVCLLENEAPVIIPEPPGA